MELRSHMFRGMVKMNKFSCLHCPVSGWETNWRISVNYQLFGRGGDSICRKYWKQRICKFSYHFAIVPIFAYVMLKRALDQQHPFLHWFIGQVSVVYCFMSVIVLGLGLMENKEDGGGIRNMLDGVVLQDFWESIWRAAVWSEGCGRSDALLALGLPSHWEEWKLPFWRSWRADPLYQ